MNKTNAPHILNNLSWKMNLSDFSISDLTNGFSAAHMLDSSSPATTEAYQNTSYEIEYSQG
jgi:hypothetical protein